MKYLRSKDIMDVLLVSRAALDCRTIKEFATEVLRYLELAFNASYSGVNLANRSGDAISVNEMNVRGLDNDFKILYRQYYHKIDPVWNSLTPRCPTVLTSDQIISHKVLIRSEFYTDFLKHWSIHHGLIFALKSANRLFGFVNVIRTHQAHTFSLQEIAKAELMSRLLSGAFEKIVALKEVSEREKIIDAVIKGPIYDGIIILDKFLEPIYFNNDAKRIISLLHKGKNGLKSSILPLPQGLNQMCQELKEGSDSKVHPNLYQRQFELPASTDKNIIGHIRFLTYGNDEPQYLIGLKVDDPADNDSILSYSHLLEKTGLTKREIEVVYFLRQGLKNTEIADKLSISENTVETHLKSIYLKLGAKNRTHLTHRLAFITTGLK